MPTGEAALTARFGVLRAAWVTSGGIEMPERRAALKRLRASVKAQAEAFARTVDADFGGRSRHETLIGEIATILGALDHALARLRRWAAPERVAVGWRFWPARAWILKQPRGVAGIMGPANFPVQLTVLPLIGAVAAGCRVLVKPSELTPATPPPAPPALGGKSPALLAPDADVARAARAIMTGKLMNAGQTCVAPDYVLIPRALRGAFVTAAVEAARVLYPDPAGPGYTAIRDPAARDRLQALLDGQDVVPLFSAPVTPPKVAPVLILDPAPSSPVMAQEIFGPLLPILSYDTLDDVIASIGSRPDPLALYWFGPDRTALRRLLERTRSGAVAAHETVLHAAIDTLPLGGIGASGFGVYHGRTGFETFTHRRPIFMQSRFSLTRLLQQPYGPGAERIMRLLLR